MLLYAATSSLLLIGGILGAGVGAVAVLYALFKNSYFLTVQNLHQQLAGSLQHL